MSLFSCHQTESVHADNCIALLFFIPKGAIVCLAMFSVFLGPVVNEQVCPTLNQNSKQIFKELICSLIHFIYQSRFPFFDILKKKGMHWNTQSKTVINSEHFTQDFTQG